MAPSDKSVAEAITTAVQHMFQGPKRDELTVNSVRSLVEATLDLERGFLKKGQWKQKSKDIVKAESDKLLRLEEAGSQMPLKQSAPSKPKSPAKKKSVSKPVNKGTKRAPDGDKVQARKRQKKLDTVATSDAESTLISIDDRAEESEGSFDSDASKPKKIAVPKRATKPLPKKYKQDEPNSSDHVKIKKADGRQDQTSEVKATVGSLDKNLDPNKRLGNSDSNLSELESQESSSSRKGGNDEGNESDSSMSIVLDETPKRRRNSKTISEIKSRISSTKSSKPMKIAKVSAQLSPDEAEIKNLQIQLTKCGVRKIWGVILKPFGTDTKAKTRHLKSMLKDVGMDGRFSEAKAREIKELRELMADLEAVKEGNEKWGMERESSDKKGSQARKKVVGGSYAQDGEDEMATQNTAPNEKPPSRVARAKMDLAFLGDESDSDN